tara:strand:+ start:198 stop:485 length:288 start_codon:yes stop_codon:yes gene_type:complete
MNRPLKTIKQIIRLGPAQTLATLLVLAAITFSAALWSEDKVEAAEMSEAPETAQQPPKSDQERPDQAADEPKPPSDFIPNEEISEDFPVPLPSDI